MNMCRCCLLRSMLISPMGWLTCANHHANDQGGLKSESSRFKIVSLLFPLKEVILIRMCCQEPSNVTQSISMQR